MRCERHIEKIGILACNGQYCQPDGFDAERIAQNFNISDLEIRVSRVRKDLLEKPESCERQHAFNQLLMAQRIKGGNINNVN